VRRQRRSGFTVIDASQAPDIIKTLIQETIVLSTVYEYNGTAQPGLAAASRTAEQLPHALLISGQRGIGKFDLARELRRVAALRSAQRGGQACGRCPACGWLAQGNHPDLRLLQPNALAEGAGSDAAEATKSGQEESQSADHHRSGACAR
jgi:hypothetical protein